MSKIFGTKWAEMVSFLRKAPAAPRQIQGRMVAVTHKMLIIAHALVKNNAKWKNKILKNTDEN